MAPQSSSIVAWIGIDWADQEHHVRLQAVGSEQVEAVVVPHRPEALHDWICQLRQRFPQGSIAVALEQARGALIYALMGYPYFVLYPVPPATLAEYRKAFFGSGAKDDPSDATLLLEILRCHSDRLHPWAPDDPLTRQLRLLVEERRTLVDDRTRLTNRVTSLLKDSFPQALEWAGELGRRAACEFLAQWPSLAALQQEQPSTLREFYRTHFRLEPAVLEQRLQQIRQARPLTSDEPVLKTSALFVPLLAAQVQALLPAIEALDKAIAELFPEDPDHHLWASLPGAGAVLAPRLLVAFGSDRQRYGDAAQLQQFSGIAPVTQRSGKSSWVHWRWACPKFVRQSFHEFAAQSIPRSPWAKAYYQQQRARGSGHHAAVRALAFKWIRILYRCWKDRVPYDEARYQLALQRRGSPLALALAAGQSRGSSRG